MKIEICEQMIQSWLINCKLCEVVQTNWTISPLRNISTAEINAIADLMLDIQDELNTKLEIDYKTALQYNIERDLSEKCDISSNEEVPQLRLPDIRRIKNLNIFKKSTAGQFVRQCEIDVVGIKLNDGNTESIYLVDSAFHKGGLGYPDVVATVLKKIIRAILVSAIIFGTKSKINVIFAAPKCGKNLEQDLNFFVDSLKNIPIIKNNYPNIIIDLYFNETFSEKIYLPMKKETDELNNDNDLFMRSMNLAKVSEENLPPSATNTNNSSNSKIRKSSSIVSKPKKRQNNKSNNKPIITLNPADLDVFKSELLNKKKAEITWFYNDGTQVSKVWNATNFKQSSDIYMNIKSRTEWRKKDVNGLVEVLVKIL